MPAITPADFAAMRERIDTALHQCAGVARGGVDLESSAFGDDRLVVYVVLQDQRVSIHEVRAELSARLPPDALPSRMVVVSALSLTDEGLVDFVASRALTILDVDFGRPFVPPQTPDEQRMAQIWSDVLGIPKLGVDDDFFELGGQSLSGMEITFRIADTWSVEISLDVLFERSTIRELAQAVTALNP